MSPAGPPPQPDAEAIAIEALAFLADRPEAFGRFLELSGVDPAAIRDLAGKPAFLAGILDYMLQDEALLLAFSAEGGISPETVDAVRRHFDDAGGSRDRDQP